MGLRSIAAILITAAFAWMPVSAGQPVTSKPATVMKPATPREVVAPLAGASVHDLNKTDLETWLDGFVPFALKNGDMAGMVVVVVKDGSVLLAKGYGYADVATKQPMDSQTTLIRPGSTSKLFTWTAVMQLVEQGKLDLDRDVNAYLDFNIPHKEGRAVTLRDLMNHRAGFEEGLKDLLTTDDGGLMSTEQYLKAHPRPLLFTPGEVPAYSNYGAALAGYIVQRVSGEPFEQYVERHIFRPLGMLHATFEQPLPAKFRAALSNGYVTASGPPQPYEYVITRPAGSMTVTAADMARFMIVHLEKGRLGNAQILKPQTIQRMHEPSEKTLPGFATMAHGFFYDRQNGTLVIGHGGDTLLFHTEMDLLPEAGVGIFFTFNSRGRDDAVYGARQALFDGFMNRYFAAPPSHAAPPVPATAAKDAAEIAGLYQSSRRVEHGFLSLFYLLQQSRISANADGTITAPAAPGLPGEAHLREVAPNLWREIGGTRELALAHIDGVKTVIDSADPVSVFQAVPFLRSSPLNLAILVGAAAILVWTLVLWPFSGLVRAADRCQSGVSRQWRRLRLFVRSAALADVIYLAAWAMLLQPTLSEQLQVYSFRLDAVVGALEAAGLVAIVAAGVGLWAAWRTFKLDSTWLSRIWTIAVAASLFGVVWIGLMGKLISFNLNY
jgi:CubicO group peptidase (beta-lactamase class C family)